MTQRAALERVTWSDDDLSYVQLSEFFNSKSYLLLGSSSSGAPPKHTRFSARKRTKQVKALFGFIAQEFSSE
ncbi:hypothetical protein OPQ81_008434 [Rhizoctonia solani]|nr:hypothetical protein OPQ81_008434 [Rhizoctonia solani]